MARSRLDSQGETLPLSKHTRLEFMRNKLLGIALWQKDIQDQELKPIIDEFISLEKDKIGGYSQEEKNKLALEAELYFSGAVSLKDEFLKIKREMEKEEIKDKLEGITMKIKELEMASASEDGDEKKLKQYLDDFHKLTKKLQEIK